MKAAVYQRYGPPEVVSIREVPTPAPKDKDVLIRVLATTVTTGDWRSRSLQTPAGFGLISRLVFGVFGPRQGILGSELAGEIAAIGKDVTRFKPGDRVVAFADMGMGCHAEFRTLAQDGGIEPMPENLSLGQAAALSFGGTTALNFLRDRGRINAADRVLINGASGGVGSAAVQLARHFGAEVTGVCSSAHLDLVTSLGADHVIDYTKQDFTTLGQRYDIICDIAGTAPYSRCKGALKDDGRLLLILGGLGQILQIPWIHLTSRHRVSAGPATVRPEQLAFLVQLAADGEFTPVIDRSYPLDQIVEAHRYVETGHKAGNVVITLQP